MGEEFTQAAVGFAVLLGLMVLRAPIGLAMLLVGAAGYQHIVGWGPLFNYLKTTPYHLFSNYTLSVVPMFILMGALADRGGLARDTFVACNALVGRLRGGLAMSVIVASAGFSAICGSSVATVATFGRATLPELRRHRYDPGLSTATIAMGGVLGILIPPSIILVIYAISTEQNIAKLFMASMIPGILTTVLYLLAIGWTVWRRPEAGPPAEPMTREEKRVAFAKVAPIAAIAVIVLGGIYGGVFTPTESAAVGTVLTLLVGWFRGSLPLAELRGAILNTAETTAMIFAILLGAEVFNAFLALTQAPDLLAGWVTEQNLSPYGVMAVLLLFYIILGAVMDELAMILLTLPVFFPVVTALDFGLTPEETAIWFGMLVLTVVGIGLTAPPIGLNVFVIAALARDVPIATVYRGVMPFLVTDIVRLGLTLAFPALSLWLVRLLT